MKRSGPLRRTGGLLRRTPLARRSAKRAEAEVERRAMRASEVAAGRRWCEACPRAAAVGVHISAVQRWPHPWADAHEPLTRARGGSITDPANVVFACRTAHEWIHAHPAEAARLGLLHHSWEAGRVAAPSD